MNIIIAHWPVLALIVFMASVNALAPPTPTSSKAYSYLYAFSHLLKLNVGEAIAAYKTAKLPKP